MNKSKSLINTIFEANTPSFVSLQKPATKKTKKIVMSSDDDDDNFVDDDSNSDFDM